MYVFLLVKSQRILKDQHRKKNSAEKPLEEQLRTKEVVKHQKIRWKQRSLEDPGQRKRPDPGFISVFSFSCSGDCGPEGSRGCKGNIWGGGYWRKRRVKEKNREKTEGENQTRQGPNTT